MSKNIRVAGFVNDSITDGPGLRFTVFLQGCKLNCPKCHNPEAQDLSGGTLYSAEEILDKIKKNPLLCGVTFSGGEPLLQANVLIPLVSKIKNLGLDIIVYSGYEIEDILHDNDNDTISLLSLCDTLIDGRYIHEKRSLSLSFRGSENQRILDTKKSIEKGQPVEVDF